MFFYLNTNYANTNSASDLKFDVFLYLVLFCLEVSSISSIVFLYLVLWRKCKNRKSEFFLCVKRTLYGEPRSKWTKIWVNMRPPNLTGPTQIHQRSSQQLFFFFFFFFFFHYATTQVLLGSNNGESGFESYNYSGHGEPLIISSSKCPHQLKLLSSFPFI